jgi:hypothetical protein
MQTQILLSFSNICEEVLYSMATEGPLSETETKIIRHYCTEILHHCDEVCSSTCHGQSPSIVDSACRVCTSSRLENSSTAETTRICEEVATEKRAL